MQQRKGSFHVLLIFKHKSRTLCTARNFPEVCSGWMEGMVRSSPAGSRMQGQTADLPGFSLRARTDARACRVVC